MALPPPHLPALAAQMSRFLADHGLPSGSIVGDGQTDDGPGLQAWLDLGRSGELPPGHYRTCQTLRVEGDSRRIGFGGSTVTLGITGNAHELLRLACAHTIVDLSGSWLAHEYPVSDAWKLPLAAVRAAVGGYNTVRLDGGRARNWREMVRVERDPAESGGTSAGWLTVYGGRADTCRFAVRATDNGPGWINGLRVFGTVAQWGTGGATVGWDFNSDVPRTDPAWCPYAAGFHVASSTDAEANGCGLYGVAVEGADWSDGTKARALYLDGSGITVEMARIEGAYVVHTGPNSMGCRVAGGQSQIQWIDEGQRQNRRDTRNANHTSASPEPIDGTTQGGTPYHGASLATAEWWEGRV